jgi:hypothetical protein
MVTDMWYWQILDAKGKEARPAGNIAGWAVGGRVGGLNAIITAKDGAIIPFVAPALDEGIENEALLVNRALESVLSCRRCPLVEAMTPSPSRSGFGQISIAAASTRG